MAEANASTRAADADTDDAPCTAGRAHTDKNIKPRAHPVHAAAQLLGIGPSKTWALIAEGKIRATRIGRRTLITDREIERVLETGC